MFGENKPNSKGDVKPGGQKWEEGCEEVTPAGSQALGGGEEGLLCVKAPGFAGKEPTVQAPGGLSLSGGYLTLCPP